MIYIHIGTRKTGSTAIQAFLDAHAERLAARGIIYAVAGRHKRPKHVFLRSEIKRSTKGAADDEWAKFRAECARHAGKTILISDESFGLLDAADTMQVRRLVGDAPATVLVYFRDYASWLPSMFAEYTKNGRNLLDFDAYFEQVMAEPSQAEVIANWGEAFGWDRVCVRVFSPKTLVDGDAVEDILHVLGTSRSALGVAVEAPVRASPGWEALETARAVLSHIAELPGGTIDDRVPLFVRTACMEAVMAVPPTGAKADYLSAEQLRRCNEKTASEILFLNSKLPPPGVPLVDPKPVTERAFLPTVLQVPAASVAAAMSHMAVLLAAQVPDGKIERKRRLDRSANKSARKAARKASAQATPTT